MQKEIEEIKKEKQQEMKMPWQGMVMISSIFLGVILSLIASFQLAKNLSGGEFSLLGFDPDRVPPIINFLQDLISTVIFGGFLIVGFLKSWKWSIHVVIFVSIFRVFSNLLGFTDLFFLDEYFWKNDLFYIISISLGTILFYGFLTYLGFACLRHPFYNQDKEIKFKSIIKRIKTYAKKNREDQKTTVEWN